MRYYLREDRQYIDMIMIRRLKKMEKKLKILIVDGDVSEAEILESRLQ